jgi:hypothetical protein
MPLRAKKNGLTVDIFREIRIRIYLPFWPNKVMGDLHCWEWQQSSISAFFFSLF